MGNWNCYEKYFRFNNEGFNWRKLRYNLYFPVAYIKFMYFYLKDLLN